MTTDREHAELVAMAEGARVEIAAAEILLGAVEAGDHTLVLLALHSVDDLGGDALVFHRSTFPRLERDPAA